MSNLIRAAALAGYAELAQSLGLDVARQLRRVGLSVKSLCDPDALIPHAAKIELLERSAVDAACPDLGLRLARRQGMDTLGVVALVFESASTLREAIDLAARYIYVHSAAARLSLVPVPRHANLVDLVLAVDLPEARGCAQAQELALAIAWQCLSLVCQGGLRSPQVMFPHARVAPAEVYEQFFGAPCVFEQGKAAIRLQRGDLELPLLRSNSVVRHVAQTYLDTQFRTPDKPSSDRVRLLIRQLLGTGLATHQEVARKLAVHPRTMQRRLSREGSSFELLKDEVRRTVFKQMIERPQAPPMASLAALLDYAEASALTRSCRRWFGASPSGLRAQLRESAAKRDRHR
ncbi:AraC family transcriptional regulator [Cupriavidus sp. 8B]